MSYLLEVFIPTLNEERRLESCVRSLQCQVLPSGLDMRIAIVDAGSRDGTRAIAERLGLGVLDNSRLKDPEAAKMVGFSSASGDFLFFMDADMQCAHPQTLSEMLTPLLKDDSIAASFGRYVPAHGDAPINRALSMNPMQCDPVYQALVPEMPKRPGLCRYEDSDIPPIAGTTLYRTSLLKKCLPFVSRYFDVDVPVHLVLHGYKRFWHASRAEFVHGHISSLRELVRKRLRNLNNGSGNGLLTEQEVPRVYQWISTSRFGRAGLFLRLARASSGIGLLPEAMSMAFRFRDPAAFLWPVLGPSVALTLFYGLLRSHAGKRYLRVALGATDKSAPPQR